MDPIKDIHTFNIYDTLFHTLSDTLFAILRVYAEIRTNNRRRGLSKSPFEFLKPLASTLNTAAAQLRAESVHKIFRQEIASEIIKHFKIDHSQITLQNPNAKNQPYTCTNNTEMSAKASLERQNS